MAKDPTLKRRRGLHLLNDRLLALKNLVRARNKEITMEYSREYDGQEKESIDGESGDNDSGDTYPVNPDRDSNLHEPRVTGTDATASGVIRPESPEFNSEGLPILHAEPAASDTEPGLKREPALIDLDDLPVLTESVSAAPANMPMGNDQPADDFPAGKAQNTDTMRTKLENSANEILKLIEAQISYANLPHANSSDHEALKRAITDHLEKHQIDS